jgi:hypothetical protein
MIGYDKEQKFFNLYVYILSNCYQPVNISSYLFSNLFYLFFYYRPPSPIEGRLKKLCSVG